MYEEEQPKTKWIEIALAILVIGSILFSVIYAIVSTCEPKEEEEDKVETVSTNKECNDCKPGITVDKILNPP